MLADPAPRMRSSRGQTFGPFNDILRPVANFLVNPADVLTENANTNQLNPAKERDEDDQRGIAPKNWPIHQFVEQVNRHQQEGKNGDDEPEHRAQCKRIGGETEDAVEPDAQRSEKTVVVCFAGKTTRAIERNQ